MATKSTPVSASKIVVLVDAKISTAWANHCSTSSEVESVLVASVELLAKAVTSSKLTVKDAQALIRSTKQESAFVSVSQIEALGVWSAMRSSADFKALKLAKQLSTASASFSLLGVETSKGLAHDASLATIQSEIKKARKVKADKSKESARAKASSAGSKKASLPDTLNGILAFFVATDMSIYTEKQLDIIAEIQTTIESKIMFEENMTHA